MKRIAYILLRYIVVLFLIGNCNKAESFGMTGKDALLFHFFGFTILAPLGDLS